VGGYLRRWGFTPQKPIYLRGERDEEEIIRWRTKEFKKIRNASIKRNAYLVFIDETGFMLSPLRRQSYAPRGQTPVIKVSDPHGRISAIGAITVSPVRQRTNLIYKLLSDNANFNSHEVIRFISRISKRIPDPITIIWDSIPIHRSHSVKDFLNGFPNIISENFPPYAPELNPVDKVWGYVKYGRLANFAPDGLAQLRSTVNTELMILREKTSLLHSFIRASGLYLRDNPI
jgi:transposase